MKKMIWGALAALSVTACADVAPMAKGQGHGSGIDTANFGKGIRPQDDLYRAVNGTWLERTQIPADKSNYGAFTKLDDDATEQIRGLIDDVAKHEQKAGSDEQRIADLYKAFMDEPTLDQLGVRPLDAELALIDAVKSKKEIPALMARLERDGVNVPLVAYVHQDNKDSTHYIGDFAQAGLGLPDRDFYLLDDAKFKDLRAKYQAHTEKMLGLAGDRDAAKSAAAIFALETRLAKAQWDKVVLRDPEKAYNKFAVAKLPALSPALQWPAFLDAAGFKSLPAVIVSQPTYVKALGRELGKTDLATWKTYLRWRVISSFAPMLSKDFADESFAFYSKALNGIEQQKPRWRRAVGVIEHGNGNPDSPNNEALGEALGKLYVAKYFPPENKARMEKLVNNLLKAYAQEFPTLDWMSPATQKAAADKLAKFSYKIGYPDRWRDFSSLAIKSDDLVGNLMRIAHYDYDYNLQHLGKPIDRQEWSMSPQTVNARYNPELNDITFPAAILHPPFFDAAADDAVNYGGIGAVIGHEISHGFDDQGSQFDGDGNLKMWWTKQDRAKFEQRAGALAAQYDAYEPVKGYHLNGKFTLGENIADLGGLTIAYQAYQLSLNGQPAPMLDDLTGDQRFFMGWSQVWRRKYREENLINRTKTDPHSPSEFRANGTPINVPAFYGAFGIKEGDKLFRPEAERIRIW
jgi:predicted metalloendopeptidase